MAALALSVIMVYGVCGFGLYVALLWVAARSEAVSVGRFMALIIGLTPVVPVWPLVWCQLLRQKN